MRNYKDIIIFGTVIILFAFLCGCTSSPNKGQETIYEGYQDVEKITIDSTELVPERTPLEEKYNNIIFRKIESVNELDDDYPNALIDCQSSCITQLNEKKRYKIATVDTDTDLAGKSLYVDMKLLDFRLVNPTFRFFLGGRPSFMDMLVELVDVDTNTVVHRKIISTSNNPTAASWSYGASDRSLPHYLGIFIGEYISKIVHSSN